MLNVAGGSSFYLSPQFNPTLTLNMYTVRDELSKWGSGLTAFPGSSLVNQNFINGYGRGQLAADSTNVDDMYVVIGNTILQYNTVLTPNAIGSLNSTTGYVAIDNNSHQFIFVDGVNGWLYDTGLSPSYQQITSANFPGNTSPANPIDVAYLDGRILVADGNSNRFYISQIDDISNSTGWQPNNYASLTTNPELLVAIREIKRRIFVFGRQTTEVWFNAGAGGFPFVRDNNMVYNFGAVTTAGVADGQDFLIWLSREKNGNPTVRLTDGGTIRKVSTDSIEKRLQALKNLNDCQAYIIKINGHIFCVFNFTQDNLSIFYDLETDEWQDLSMSDGSRYFGATHAYFQGIHYVTSYNNSSLYEVSDSYLSNNGDNIHCLRILPFIKGNDMRPVHIVKAELDCVTGTGLNATPQNINDADPQIYLSASVDGGYTYGNSVLAGVGKIGQYQRRVVWPPLGVFEKGCVLKLEHFNQTQLVMMGLDLEISAVGY